LKAPVQPDDWGQNRPHLRPLWHSTPSSVSGLATPRVPPGQGSPTLPPDPRCAAQNAKKSTVNRTRGSTFMAFEVDTTEARSGCAPQTEGTSSFRQFLFGHLSPFLVSKPIKILLHILNSSRNSCGVRRNTGLTHPKSTIGLKAAGR